MPPDDACANTQAAGPLGRACPAAAAWQFRRLARKPPGGPRCAPASSSGQASASPGTGQRDEGSTAANAHPAPDPQCHQAPHAPLLLTIMHLHGGGAAPRGARCLAAPRPGRGLTALGASVPLASSWPAGRAAAQCRCRRPLDSRRQVRDAPEGVTLPSDTSDRQCSLEAQVSADRPRPAARRAPMAAEAHPTDRSGIRVSSVPWGAAARPPQPGAQRPHQGHPALAAEQVSPEPHALRLPGEVSRERGTARAGGHDCRAAARAPTPRGT